MSYFIKRLSNNKYRLAIKNKIFIVVLKCLITSVIVLNVFIMTIQAI